MCVLIYEYMYKNNVCVCVQCNVNVRLSVHLFPMCFSVHPHWTHPGTVRSRLQERRSKKARPRNRKWFRIPIQLGIFHM